MSVNGGGGNILYLTFVILIYKSCICSHMAHVGSHMYPCPGPTNVRRVSMQKVEAECAAGLCVSCSELSASPAFSCCGGEGIAFNFTCSCKPTQFKSQKWLFSFIGRTLRTYEIF